MRTAPHLVHHLKVPSPSYYFRISNNDTVLFEHSQKLNLERIYEAALQMTVSQASPVAKYFDRDRTIFSSSLRLAIPVNDGLFSAGPLHASA